MFETLPGALQSVLNCLLPLFSTPRGRDVLLYPDRATFYNPVHPRRALGVLVARADERKVGVLRAAHEPPRRATRVHGCGQKKGYPKQ